MISGKSSCPKPLSEVRGVIVFGQVVRKSTLSFWIIFLLISSTISIDNLSPDNEDTNNNLRDINFELAGQKTISDWSSSGSAPSNALVRGMDVGSNGDIVLAGVMSSGMTLSMGSQSVTSNSYLTPWFAKSDSSGNWLWAETIVNSGISQNSEVTVSDIVVASNGDIFATGMFYESATFGSIVLTSTGYYDFWIAKLTSSGQWAWAEALHGNGDYDGTLVTTLDVVWGTSITTDSNNDVYAGGLFLGNTDVGVATDTGGQSSADIEVFIAKYSNSGNLQWTEVARGSGAQEVNSMIADSNNNIWIATTFEISMAFGSYTANAGINEVPAGIAKIDSSGNWQAAYATVGNGQPVVTGFDFDSSNDLLMTGVFSNSLTFGNQISSAGSTDAFIASISPSGTWNWGKSIGGSSYDTSSNIIYDSITGYTIVGMTSSSSFSFGGNSFSPRGYNDSLVVTFDSNGNELGLFDAGSTLDDSISDINIISSGEIVVAGNYNGTMDFGQSSASSQSSNSLMPYLWLTSTIAIIDSDSDGLADEDDNCPNIANPNQENTDLDSEGDACDSDDDNDGITDNFPDNCPRNSQTGWTSTRDFDNPSASTDWDNDGCKDDHPEDLDDDNDGKIDTLDNCPLSMYSPPRPTWVSDLATDMDSDGCRDADEDDNDDGDSFDDSSDDCSTTYGTSTLGRQGCIDSDQDGWDDESDNCPLEVGNSSENGKVGCLDSDGDGWANVDDDFDYEPTQWMDADGDGYGDRLDGVNPDDCLEDSGDSYIDRNGCRDTDGDGYSNPDDSWDTGSGADAFVEDVTQWSDFDDDGFGDNWGNLSWTDRSVNWPGQYLEGAIQSVQDACPLQFGNSTQGGIIGCPDQDGDGWYDSLDTFIFDSTQWLDSDGDGFGDNQMGNQADSCLDIAGNSTADRFGCLDSDGDGYSDSETSWSIADGADAFITDSTQWKDTDVDNYGDNQLGFQPDGCVNIRGTSTIDRFGCPDFDDDGYSDPSDSWSISQGADACYNVKGNSTNDRVGCYDSDGDGYSNVDPDWDYSNGADGYPDDPTKWDAPIDSDTASSSTVMLIGGGVFILIAIVLGGLLFTRRSRDGDTKMFESQLPMMNQMQGQVSTQAGPPVQQHVTQNMQPDPAMEYYQTLVSQGYPHANALAYTQQYYPHFNA